MQTIVVMMAIIKEERILPQIKSLIMAQLSPTVASSAGRKALMKIINKGMITKIKETIRNGISKTQFLLVFFGPCTRYFKILESKLIWIPLNFINHNMDVSSVSI
jgi:hypothetical protein